MKQRILEEWNNFSQAVMPQNVSKAQRTDMRRAFYAGAAGYLNIMLKYLEGGKEDTENDLKMMNEMQSELEKFYDDVKKGIA